MIVKDRCRRRHAPETAAGSVHRSEDGTCWVPADYDTASDLRIFASASTRRRTAREAVEASVSLAYADDDVACWHGAELYVELAEDAARWTREKAA